MLRQRDAAPRCRCELALSESTLASPAAARAPHASLRKKQHEGVAHTRRPIPCTEAATRNARAGKRRRETPSAAHRND